MLTRKLLDCKKFVALSGHGADDNAVLRETLRPAKGVKIRYSLAHAAMKPGKKTQPHKLKHGEVYYILEGTGKLHADKETKTVRKDDTVYIPPRKTQWMENTGKKPLKFLCIVDPAWTPECEL